MIGAAEYNECHFASNKTGVCSDDAVITKIAPLSNVDLKSPYLTESVKQQIIDDLKTKTNCDSESCLFETDLLKKAVGNTTSIIKETFKPQGPYDSDDWLDNFNIDHVLKQNMEKYKDFYAIPFQMIDFAKQKSELATLELDKLTTQYNTAAVVINTDISTGKGKHWFAIFMDFRKTPYTIEFFNSSEIYRFFKYNLG